MPDKSDKPEKSDAPDQATPPKSRARRRRATVKLPPPADEMRFEQLALLSLPDPARLSPRVVNLTPDDHVTGCCPDCGERLYVGLFPWPITGCSRCNHHLAWQRLPVGSEEAAEAEYALSIIASSPDDTDRRRIRDALITQYSAWRRSERRRAGLFTDYDVLAERERERVRSALSVERAPISFTGVRRGA